MYALICEHVCCMPASVDMPVGLKKQTRIAKPNIPLSNLNKESCFSFFYCYMVHWPIPRTFQLDHRKKTKRSFRRKIIDV